MPIDDPNQDPTRYKIFPRNLTARASHIVRGNPTNSRPEAGVNNSFPGLEADQRNLEQRFFPGLTFYFHRNDGAILADIHLEERQRGSGLEAKDNPPSRRLYLWGMYGRSLVEETEPMMFSFRGRSGMEVWRRVHDLLPGTVTILFGPEPGVGADLTFFPEPMVSSDSLQGQLEACHAATANNDAAGQYVVQRDDKGVIEYAMFSDERARYLDEEGVIDPEAYEAGELTKSMCAPWMYDFRDCYCFYWSSNKPDIVDSADGRHRDLDFIRGVREREQDPPPPDVDFYWKMADGKFVQRRDFELDYKDMVEGWWHKLPIVLNDRESEAGFDPVIPAPPVTEYLGREELIEELRYLARVEHAVTVEYLYASYSVDAPRQPPSGSSDAIDQRIFAAASQVFRIAIDEMRHLLWANMALNILGSPPEVGRAKMLGASPGPRRKVFTLKPKTYLDRPFSLEPLDGDTIDWFIDVEAPSKQANVGLDGMYVEVLESIRQQPDIFPEHERLAPLLKLIIDEGEGHWERFLAIKETLAGIPEERYLRAIGGDEPNELQKAYVDLTNDYYHTILEAIETSFSLGPKAGGELIDGAIRAMHSLDEIALLLGEQGFLPPFDLPSAEALVGLAAPATPLELLRRRRMSFSERFDELARHGDSEDLSRALRHQEGVFELFGRAERLAHENRSL